MTPRTFVHTYNRNGRAYLATGYVCQHGVLMRDCPAEEFGPEVEERMVEWWNNSFTQMQDRITVRDNLLRGNNG